MTRPIIAIDPGAAGGVAWTESDGTVWAAERVEAAGPDGMKGDAMKYPNPKILIDTREQAPLVFANCPTAGGTLATGDYSIQGFEDEFTIERKSLDDLAGSCTHDRERFERELVRLRGYAFRRLVIIGTVAEIEAHRYRSRAEPKAILASVTAFEIRYGLPVAFCPTPGAAALQVERWAFYYLRERLTTASGIVERYLNHAHARASEGRD